ncbi:MAG: AraC family transcriptional regulator [Rhizobiaceae bacterium]|nr:MAG: AraC family transcriptional regulator [Rhizobiaceae bacterium]
MDAAAHPEPQSGPPDWLRRAVRPQLAGLVDDIVFYRETGLPMVGQVEAASLVVPLVISFAAPFSIALGRTPHRGDAIASFAAGLYAGPVVMDSPGTAECVQVNFTPLGAARFFGLPLSELADAMVTLDDLGDRALRGLRERLGDEPDAGRRLDLVEAFVVRRVFSGRPCDPEIAWAYRRIVASSGRVRIAGLAEEIGCSRRHLFSRFRRDVGLAPKTVGRMARFQGALAWSTRVAAPDWADVAAACGYADQAHLTREFTAFAGSSPAAWLRRAA